MSLSAAQISTPATGTATTSRMISTVDMRGLPNMGRQAVDEVEVGRGAGVELPFRLHGLCQEVPGLAVVAAQGGGEAGVVERHGAVVARPAGRGAGVVAA